MPLIYLPVSWGVAQVSVRPVADVFNQWVRSLRDTIMTPCRRRQQFSSLLLHAAVAFWVAALPTTIEIRQQIASGVDAILADPTQIYQIVMNLCTHAAHAMREGGGLLEMSLDTEEIKPEMLSLYPDLKPGRYVKLTVRDTGTGIPSAVIGRIFDPFFTTTGVSGAHELTSGELHGIAAFPRATL